MQLDLFGNPAATEAPAAAAAPAHVQGALFRPAATDLRPRRAARPVTVALDPELHDGALVDATIAATRVGPSDYVLETPAPTVGMRFRAAGELLEVVGEPILVQRTGWSARVREIGGRHDGNEFAAYLRTVR